MKAPFPYFGGKRDIAVEVWRRFGSPKQYIEPFCGSAAVLLAAPRPAALEVINDVNGFIANFWRAAVNQPSEVARWADYPVSHVDLGARHLWLMGQRDRIGAGLLDAEWPGDAKVAGWWLWGQCCWIGSGWCEWFSAGQIPLVGNAGRGIQAAGQIPRASDAGVGIQAVGRIPHVSDAGRGDPFWTSAGRTAWTWLHKLAARLERVRVVHGSWERCLNHQYGGDKTAVLLDPPYEGYEEPYRTGAVAQDVAAWCRENGNLRIALCGLRGDYDLDGWTVLDWERTHPTFGGDKTKDAEAIWFSPACIDVARGQGELFALMPDARRLT